MDQGEDALDHDASYNKEGHQSKLICLDGTMFTEATACGVIMLPPDPPITSVLDLHFSTDGAILEGGHSPEEYNKGFQWHEKKQQSIKSP